MRGARGFTIIELMIVVTIIGILAALAIPVFQGYTTRAKISEGPMLAQPVKIAIADFFTTKGNFPADNTDLGLDAPATLRGKYVASVEVIANGVIVVTYGDPSVSGRTLTFTPTALDRAVQWNCVTTLPPQLTPKGC